MSQLHIFNPDCEMAIANGSPYYTPSASVLKMINDLALLPAYYADKEDYIWVSEKPDTAFLNQKLQDIALNFRIAIDDEIATLPISGITPWGWTPRLCRQGQNLPGTHPWNPNDKELYSRRKALECLTDLQQKNASIATEITPVICHTISEIADMVGEGHYIAKAPWSSSGRGILPLSGRPTVKEQEWLQGILRKQKYIMIEKRLDKVLDFALEFQIDTNRQIHFCGLSLFTTGAGGEYRGNFVGNQQHIEQQITTYITTQLLHTVRQQLTETLSNLIAPHYIGPLGVDMMIYRTTDGDYAIQPCIEINLRHNMGIVALHLSHRFLAPDTCAQFTIKFFPGTGEALCEHNCLLKNNPPVFRDHRLFSGYMNLTPVNPSTSFIAALQTLI